ncbi:MAG TPA: hypothetical protein VGE36_14250 [Roseateles sp.]
MKSWLKRLWGQWWRGSCRVGCLRVEAVIDPRLLLVVAGMDRGIVLGALGINVHVRPR